MLSEGPADLVHPSRADLAADVARLRLWARVVLVPVGVFGAALSFASSYEAARPSYGPCSRRASRSADLVSDPAMVLRATLTGVLAPGPAPTVPHGRCTPKPATTCAVP